MKPLRIDLMPPRHPPSGWWWAVGALGVAAAALWGWHTQQRSELRQLQEQTAKLNQAEQMRRQAAQTKPPVQKPAHDASARALLWARQLPWPSVLATMESITIEGATPTVLDVNAADRSARIEINAVSYAAVLAYLQALNQGDPALQWRLLQVSSGGGDGVLMTAVLVAALGP
jgi:type II secretory pathway pseudopilin PulG